MAEKHYLKNAWAKKDADGVYWLFIEGSGLQSTFCLYRPKVDPITGKQSMRTTAYPAALSMHGSQSRIALTESLNN